MKDNKVVVNAGRGFSAKEGFLILENKPAKKRLMVGPSPTYIKGFRAL